MSVFWYLDSMRNSIPVVLRCFSQFLSVIKNRQFQRSYTSWILFLRYARDLTCSCSGSSLLAFAHLRPSYLKIFFEKTWYRQSSPSIAPFTLGPCLSTSPPCLWPLILKKFGEKNLNKLGQRRTPGSCSYLPSR